MKKGYSLLITACVLLGLRSPAWSSTSGIDVQEPFISSDLVVIGRMKSLEVRWDVFPPAIGSARISVEETLWGEAEVGETLTVNTSGRTHVEMSGYDTPKEGRLGIWFLSGTPSQPTKSYEEKSWIGNSDGAAGRSNLNMALRQYFDIRRERLVREVVQNPFITVRWKERPGRPEGIRRIKFICRNGSDQAKTMPYPLIKNDEIFLPEGVRLDITQIGTAGNFNEVRIPVSTDPGAVKTIHSQEEVSVLLDVTGYVDRSLGDNYWLQLSCPENMRCY